MEPQETQEETAIPEHIENMPLPPTEVFVVPSKKPYKKLLLAMLIILLAGSAVAYFILAGGKKTPATSVSKAVSTAPTQSILPKTQGLKLDPNKNYGNKYASGILPVGDSHYATDAAKTGYIFACAGYAQNLNPSQGGAGSRGPWFTNNNTQYDMNKKLHVLGAATWQPSLLNNVLNSTRTIVTNDLPNHTTGVFPISVSDPAYSYDRNPNSIKAQTLDYKLSSNPSYSNPTCMGGEAGVMLTGVALFNGFDAGGRDAGAWEIQDSCGGHPQKDGEYHYHTLSSCIKETSVKTVIGFALDGYPITGPQVGTNNILTTADLDECHGIISQVVLDGKPVTTYHYVMTQDFPYSLSCFRAAPSNAPNQPNSGKPQT